jgi:uncharacterized small protein (DUF1192 family)
LPDNGKPENIATAVNEVSERVTVLVREEIELAKAEVTAKVTSLAKGAAAIAFGAIFFLLFTLAWVLDAILTSSAGDIWVGYLIVLALLAAATVGAFLFAWRKLKVGAPTPKMAIDEAKKIRETVSSKPDVPS